MQDSNYPMKKYKKIIKKENEQNLRIQCLETLFKEILRLEKLGNKCNWIREIPLHKTKHKS